MFKGFLVALSGYLVIGLIVATWKFWIIGDARVLVDSAMLWTAGAVAAFAIYFAAAALVWAVYRFKRRS